MPGSRWPRRRCAVRTRPSARSSSVAAVWCRSWKRSGGSPDASRRCTRVPRSGGSGEHRRRTEAQVVVLPDAIGARAFPGLGVPPRGEDAQFVIRQLHRSVTAVALRGGAPGCRRPPWRGCTRRVSTPDLVSTSDQRSPSNSPWRIPVDGASRRADVAGSRRLRANALLQGQHEGKVSPIESRRLHRNPLPWPSGAGAGARTDLRSLGCTHGNAGRRSRRPGRDRPGRNRMGGPNGPCWCGRMVRTSGVRPGLGARELQRAVPSGRPVINEEGEKQG